MQIGYIRVSTNDQNTDLQRNALNCAGCELIFEDKISGTKSARPGLKKLLRTLSEGDTLVVWKLDRLGRSMKHLITLIEELREKGVNFRSLTDSIDTSTLNRPGFPGECFICELRLPDHRFRWKHNKLFLLLPEEYGPAFPAIVDCYTSPPTLVWPVPLLHGFSSSYGVLPPLCKDH